MISVYGKLALKFEHYFKRWMHIFYPREISTSLEEKNRQLMNLINRNGGDEAYLNENNENTNASSNQENHENKMNGTNLNGELEDGDPSDLNENRTLFDFSNSNHMLNGSGRKKRKPNPDKDKYIQEPQYVTKRTSSGRLVKMKIINDFDYTSDQEQEGGAGRKRRKQEDDAYEGEGIQKKHRKHSASSFSDSSDNDNDDSSDEDFKRYRKPNESINKSRQTPGERKPRERRTIRQLTAEMNNVFEDSDDGDNDLNLSNFSKRFNNQSLTITNVPSTLDENTDQPKLTFEQYVRKLTGSYTTPTISTTSSASASSMSKDSLSSFSSQTSATIASSPSVAQRFSLKIAPSSNVNLNSSSNVHSSSSTANKLSIPVINPAIKAQLNKLAMASASSTNVNITNDSSEAKTNTTVKIITMNNPNLSQSNTANISNLNGIQSISSASASLNSPSLNKKVVIINNSQSQQIQSPNLVKVINISQIAANQKPSTPLQPNRPIIMINQGLTGLKPATTQVITTKSILTNIQPVTPTQTAPISQPSAPSAIVVNTNQASSEKTTLTDSIAAIVSSNPPSDQVQTTSTTSESIAIPLETQSST